MFATDTTVQKIMLGFDFNRLFDESTMYMITSEEANLDFNTLEGLIDVNLQVLSQVTTVSATVKATFDYGTALNPLLFKGALLADFSLINNATLAVTPITAISEPTEGNYVILATFIPTVSYTLKVVKTGFTGSKVFVAI
jgi:hypothetical protein